MRRCQWLCAAVIAAAALLPPVMAHARSGDFYVGLGAGGIFTQKTNFNLTGLIAGTSAIGSGKLSFNPGESVIGFGSYSINSYINFAVQIGYVAAQISSFDGGLSLGGLGSINGTIPVHGNVSAWANLYNLVVTPLGQDHAFSPYFGAGLGFAVSRASLRSINAKGLTLPISLNSGDTDVAGDFLIGADYRVAPRLNLGLVYQFVRISAGSLGTTDEVRARTGPILSHFLGGLFEYRF